MAVYEVMLENGQIVEVDDSSLGNYVNPETGELQLDIVAQELNKVLNEQPAQQQQTGMSAEQKDAFGSANKTLQQTGKFITPRGDNLGGALRNVAVGAIPASDELEAYLRSPNNLQDRYREELNSLTEEEKQLLRNNPTALKSFAQNLETSEYEKYLQNARESQKGFAAQNPITATILQIGGGLASSLLPFGFASKGATLASQAGRGALAGLGQGAVFGYASGEGGVSNRLDDALFAGLAGGAVGGVVPAVMPGLKVIGGTANRFVSGLGQERLPAKQVEAFILNNALQNTPEARLNASILGAGSRAGAQDIYKPAYYLNDVLKTANKLNVPSLYQGTTPAGTTINDILKATKSPVYTASQETFSEFAQNNPMTTKGGIAQASQFLKRNPVANKVLNEIKGFENVDPDSFSWWQNAERALTNKLPKNYDPLKLKGGSKKIYDAVQDISKTREGLFPGVSATNINYATGKATQDTAEKVANQRLGSIVQTPQQKGTGGGFLGFISNRIDPIFDRGRARQLIKTGTVEEKLTPKAIRNVGTATDAVLRALTVGM